LAGIVTKDKYNILQHRSIGHFTHEKNPLSCAAGLAEIEYIEKQGLVDNSRLMGEYLMQKLEELKEEFSIIGNIAGKGLHIGVDLVKDRITKERAENEAEQIMYDCLKQGIAFKVIEGNILTMRPALIIGKDECDLIVTAFKNALQRL